MEHSNHDSKGGSFRMTEVLPGREMFNYNICMKKAGKVFRVLEMRRLKVDVWYNMPVLLLGGAGKNRVPMLMVS